MNGPMAAPAHEGEVAEARFAALDQVLEVMGISPPGRAAWELAVAIPQHQRLAQRRRDHPGRPAHAQNLRAGTHLDAGPLPRLRRVLPRLRGTPSPGCAGYSPDSAGERAGSELNVAVWATSIRCGR